MAPRVTVTKRVGRASNYWLTGEALAAKRRRRQLERKWKRSGTEDDRSRYRLACRQANNAINLARQQHHRNILEESKHDPKRRWKFIKGLLHSSPVKPETTELEDANLSVSFGTFFQNKIKSPCFNRYQSAYRTGHSTETALLRITDNVLRAIDNKRATILVELDLSAAFDMIDHQLLIRRLELSYGVSGTALDLMNSYLHGRSQVINVNGQCSPSAQCVIGVPQGSVLGPLLFSAFISPIANVTRSFGVEQHQYADDTSLFITVSRDDRVTQVQRLSECTLEVQSWFTLNGMALNPDKSEVLHMCPIRHHKANTGIDTLAVGGVEIKLATKVKLLGVTLDDHVKTVCGNAMYHIRALRHIRRSITEECANTIACSVVSSRIDYCNSIFTGMSSFNVRGSPASSELCRLVWSSGVGRSEHITEHLRKLHWLPCASSYRL